MRKPHERLSDVLNYHSEADVGLFEGGTIIGAVTSDSHYFSIGTNFASNDSFDQGILVHRL